MDGSLCLRADRAARQAGRLCARTRHDRDGHAPRLPPRIGSDLSCDAAGSILASTCAFVPLRSGNVADLSPVWLLIPARSVMSTTSICLPLSCMRATAIACKTNTVSNIGLPRLSAARKGTMIWKTEGDDRAESRAICASVCDGCCQGATTTRPAAARYSYSLWPGPRDDFIAGRSSALAGW